MLSCPAMLVFDKERKRCVNPPTADCDIPKPERVEGDDLEGGQPGGEGGEDFVEDGGEGGQLALSEDVVPSNVRPAPENRRRFQGGQGPSNPRRETLQQGRPPLPPGFQLPDGVIPLSSSGGRAPN